ncbi:MAG: diphthine--ammonia ligase [Planctomycetes bacterium]|nr:diphthine--ammonia ligase [Planctomycetota bacterium]
MYIASWSGGKDSCQACWKAMQSGLKVSHLVNFISAEYKRVSFHGIKSELIQLQADAIGIPLLQKEVHPDDYEPAFKEAVLSVIARSEATKQSHQVNEIASPVRARNDTGKIKGMVFGDIYLQEHKQWVTRVCQEMGIEAIEPLWGMRTEDILNEFIRSGFEAIVVSVKADAQFGPYGIAKEWIGHKVDEEFIHYLKTKPYIDLCGESGEYHTFVVNGPLFKKRIGITRKEVIERDTPYGKWYFLDLEPLTK